MNLQNLKALFTNNGCEKVFVKNLSPNDNSKNQIYLGGNFEVLNILPISEIRSDDSGDWNSERFKASIKFSWISEEGQISNAPQAQLILYPQYPEVRFSGFLARCKNAPSELMTQRLNGRLLFLGITSNGNILAHVVAPDSEVANEFNSFSASLENQGVFYVFELTQTIGNREKLLSELYRIHLLEWITAKRLDKNGNILPCKAPNCGGYTLEAELGIKPNGYSEPDYLGWEVKQYGVSNLSRLNSAIITLMTPEPTHGFYATDGTEEFIKKYGYNDLMGRQDRMNFGGIHKYGSRHTRTNLQLELIGFDINEGKIRNANGYIGLIDRQDNIAASWSFSSLLLHWNRKHNKACYIPSLSDTAANRMYKYGNSVLLGTGTDFQLFLQQMALGNIYYDPGIKLENMSTTPKVKKRSQFRIKSLYLQNLYKTNEVVTLGTT